MRRAAALAHSDCIASAGKEISMRTKTTLVALAAASLLGAGVTAQAAVNAVVTIAPPAPLVEVVPAPRRGYVWAPGHYEWRHGEYTWTRGHWLSARHGYEYREPRWVQRGNGEWVMVGNSWERGAYGDRDHDGVPNRYDADSRRFSGPRGDMDGDGVQNRYDRHPRNPNRS
jgi:hypothetical protein